MDKDIANIVAKAVGLPLAGVTATIRLLDEGATVPFIARYRKEATGSLTDIEVRSIEEALRKARDIEARRSTVIAAIEAAGAMTDALRRRIDEASTLTEIEDIYAPFKPRKRTRATIAREKSLEPMAKIIMSGRMPKGASADDIAGASDIIAEWASESARLRNITRRTLRRNASIEATCPRGKATELAESKLASYDGFSRPVRNIASHQYLAMRRGEREGLLKLRFAMPDGDGDDRLVDTLCRSFGPGPADPSARATIDAAVTDAYKRLLRPSIENEIAAELKESADRVAIDIFAGNLRQLLLAAPLKGRRVLAIDPGFRTGCKVVALDESGMLLDDAVIYPTPPRSDTDGAANTLRRLIDHHRLNAIALGNGTASRETEQFLRAASIMDRESIYVVSEDGASVYSASPLAQSEFPDKDVTVRGAVSIGRRLIDPLAELVKIDPKSIGVGQYQHDVDQSALKDALDYTVMACVNSVGVDLNTASPSLLAYVSGIGPSLANGIVEFRDANGPFRSRADLKKVPRLGPKAFQQSAGFLRISGGTQPLDNTGIHPESYAAVKAIATRAGVNIEQLLAPGNPHLDQLDAKALAMQGIAGAETIADIIAELRKPGRDPRTDTTSEAFTPDVASFEQLSVGQQIAGIVSNITAFGAFINLGIKEQGLIHISQLSPRRVRSVSDILAIGQHITARIIDLDPIRRRISLSLL